MEMDRDKGQQVGLVMPVLRVRNCLLEIVRWEVVETTQEVASQLVLY